MFARTLTRWFLITGFLVLVAVAWCAISTSPAAAQCGTTDSSCVSCHGQGNHVTGMGDWNSVHLNQDICTSCHGGNGTTMDKNLAHEGIVIQPLSDIYTDCHSCHPTDYTARSAQFVATLNVTPGSCATPTPIAISNAPGEPPSGSINIAANPASTTQPLQSFLVVGVCLLLLTLFLFGLGWLERHHVCKAES